MENHRLNSTKLFGFCEGKSAFDLMLVLTGKWQEALNNGNDTVVVAIDIAGVFEQVWLSGLLAKLKSFGITGAILTSFENYLTERELRVVLNERTDDLLDLLPQAYAFAK